MRKRVKYYYHVLDLGLRYDKIEEAERHGLTIWIETIKIK